MKNSCLIVEDDEDFANFLKKALSYQYDILICSSIDEGKKHVIDQKFDLILCDYRVLDETPESFIQLTRQSSANKYTPLILISSVDDVSIIVKLFDLGIDDFVHKSVTPEEILARIKAAKRLRDLYFYADKLANETERLKKLTFCDFLIGDSPKFLEALEICKRVSQTDAPVLLLGETGVGKDVVARKIHEWSSRKGEFVSVNISALPKDLIEAELFGYEKGSFSGATSSKPGLIEMADQGTLFLDEIGEMPLDLQPKLLRVLQDKKVRRVGGLKETPIDFRLVSATCKNLFNAVKDGSFREDLFYRINLVTCTLPPLRERSGDIIKLANHFLKLAEARFNLGPKSFSQRCLNSLINYSWPGNIRELENTIYRFYLTSTSDLIDFVLQKEEQTDFTGEFNLEGRISLIEKSLFQEALQASKGNKSKAARLLGISRVTLIQKLKKYGLNFV